jgi:hypothetical protein
MRRGTQSVAPVLPMASREPLPPQNHISSQVDWALIVTLNNYIQLHKIVAIVINHEIPSGKLT